MPEQREASSMGSPSSGIFKSYPITRNGARSPQLDEETGRIAQESRRSFRVIDTTALYMNNDELGVKGDFS